ncbi:dihydroneopterin triphosphate diphosphatase [Hydrogenophaga crassostreae]|uniref:Dihydroneopterin triphosphate diphosphatase n=1 Tax=Hydrogenophaga crassostreae TaxID=1763535 RepID=A0A162YZ67_9BURK|nr:dihydroneopterin triphosphate diphosphatase [Hydrogenophaga crassostreae]AOW15381.1 dihydroneopterin triphosphate diphosphatase [Hydrogenophaga crassostreae]OAD41337.1 dihydroneopterin triphosphate diphosphatase [Hydrogenophaga crassostreae]
MVQPHKIPESVLVVIYTPALEVLLIERADASGFWQSVTGSKDSWEEAFIDTAAREVWEETGLDVRGPGCQLTDWGLENRYEIYPAWRTRYAPGVIENRERVFGLRLEQAKHVCLNPLEHLGQQWLPWIEAADKCFSPSNAEAILLLPSFDLSAVDTPRV